MRAWNLQSVNLAVVVAALLLPGGFLILAWAIYRRCFPLATSIVKRLVPLAILAALLQGCATQLGVRGADGGDDASARQRLLFQSSDIAPKTDEAALKPNELRPGDIILTTSPGLVGASIQLVTWSPITHAAIYLGDGRIVEALRPVVRVRRLDELLAEDFVVMALRHPGLSAEQAQQIRDYGLQKAGTPFNYMGVTLHVPYSVARRVCELPLVPSPLRDACLRSVGMMNYLASNGSRLFCSQLVLDAYRQAGLPITDADPRLITPSDLLHMREGDVASVRIHRPLRYVGHLKYEPPVTVAALGQ